MALVLSALASVTLMLPISAPPHHLRAAGPCMAASPDLVSRRGAFAALALGASSLLLPAPAARASGGATAGKYTTIPIAKRRYFGRVKQGVFQFLQAGKDVQKGDLKGESIEGFFSDTIAQKSKRRAAACARALPGQACDAESQFSSRWDDMKLSCFLLGNAFRMDSGKPPEKVKQVKEARAFFSEVGKLEAASKAGDKKAAARAFLAAEEYLNVYLNDVELPPTVDAEYAQEADTQVVSLCQGNFCM